MNKSVDFKWYRIATYSFITITIIFLLGWGLYKINSIEYITNLINFNSFDLLLSQIANTLIVLSLASVLSTNIGSIYWEDIKELKLVRPFFWCFYALATYLITAMLMAIFFYIFNNQTLLIAAFSFSILTLVFLSFRMIWIYLGNKKIKDTLTWEYLVCMLNNSYSYYGFYNYLNKIQQIMKQERIHATYFRKKYIVTQLKWYETFEIASEDFYAEMKKRMTKYDYNYIQDSLYEKTVQALSINDLETVKENINLLILVADWGCLFKILDSIVRQNPTLAIDVLSLVKTKLKKEEENIINKKNEIELDNYLGLLTTFKKYNTQLSKDAKGILHNISENQYTTHMIKSLLFMIGNETFDLENTKNIKSRLSELESERIEEICDLEKKGLDLETFIAKSAHIDEKYYEKYKTVTNTFVGTIGESYKPIFEMYVAYLQQKFNLLELYLNILYQDYINCKKEVLLYFHNAEETAFPYLTENETEILSKILKIDDEKKHLISSSIKKINLILHNTLPDSFYKEFHKELSNE